MQVETCVATSLLFTLVVDGKHNAAQTNTREDKLIGVEC